MDLHLVSSSNIEAVGYDPATRTLRVRFKGGTEYDYEDVAEHKYTAMRTADSVGSYFHAHVKSAHKATKRDPDAATGTKASS